MNFSKQSRINKITHTNFKGWKVKHNNKTYVISICVSFTRDITKIYYWSNLKRLRTSTLNWYIWIPIIQIKIDSYLIFQNVICYLWKWNKGCSIVIKMMLRIVSNSKMQSILTLIGILIMQHIIQLRKSILRYKRKTNFQMIVLNGSFETMN